MNIWMKIGLAAMLPLLAGCRDTTLMSTQTYINNSQTQTGAERVEADRRKMLAAIPQDDQGYVHTVRLWGGNPSYKHALFIDASAYNGVKTVEEWQEGGLLDVALQIDLRAGLPVYRFVLKPVDFGAETVARWSGAAVLDLAPGPWPWPLRFVASLPGDRRLVDGRLATDWTFCAECMFGEAVGKRGQARLKKITDMTRELAQTPDGTAFVIKSFNIASGRQPILVSGDRALAAAETALAEREAMLNGSVLAADDNKAYLEFFRTEHDPLSFDAFASASDCPTEYAPYYPFGNVASTHLEDARSARRYGECHRRLMGRYDYAGYGARYPGLVAREAELWARTAGLERKRVLSPQDQLDFARARVDGAFDNAALSEARVGSIRDSEAAGARQRAATQQMFLESQAMINDMQRQVQGMTPVVRADGTVSSVGRERAVAAAAAAAAQSRRNSPKADAPSGGSSSARTSAGVNTSNALSSARATAAQASSSTRKPTTDDRGSIEVVAEERRPADEALLRRQREKERRDAIVSLRASITPFRGGELSCVEVVDIDRVPGKRANSSCSSSEPDREALYLTFSNRCDMPINIEIDVSYDTGGFKKSHEYDVKSGRSRKTVGYCGATNYNWRIEETSDSVRRRRDEAEARYRAGTGG